MPFRSNKVSIISAFVEEVGEEEGAAITTGVCVCVCVCAAERRWGLLLFFVGTVVRRAWMQVKVEAVKTRATGGYLDG